MSVLSVTKFRAGAIASAMVLGLMSFHLQAQDQVARVKVVVPFDFTDGSKQFKAGTYTIGVLNQSTALIRSWSNTGMAAMQSTIDAKPAERGRVTFHKYGDRYYISDIFSAGRLDHLHIIKSADEKKASRLFDESRHNQQTVAVVEMPH